MSSARIKVNTMTYRFATQAVFFFLYALFLSTSFVNSGDQDTSRIQDLASRADKEGSVRVIIQLQERNHQRDTGPTQTTEGIERIQNEVISDLGSRAGSQPNVIHKYQFSPTVVLDLDKKGIEILSQDERVKNIAEDRPVAPFSFP